MGLEIFKGRNVLVASMHEKERVIAPVFEAALGAVCVPAKDFNTDIFGTFSGEIERINDPLATAVMKCQQAYEQFGCSLVVASEGSFGPHPSMFFVNADDELIVLKDFENNLEFKARVQTTETNFGAKMCHEWSAVQEFASRVQFPTHRLIVRRNQYINEEIVKGISSWYELKAVAQRFLGAFGAVYIETDMRAMSNPTRMKIIEQATLKLVETISHLCPQCSTPGFCITKIKEGLPCEICGFPTTSTLAHVYECQRCNYTEEISFPNNRTTEEAMFCNWCNP